MFMGVFHKCLAFYANTLQKSPEGWDMKRQRVFAS